MMFSWAKNTVNKSTPSITLIDLDSFLDNANNNQPKEWSLNADILLKFTIREIKEIKKHPDTESITIDTIEAAVDKVAKDYARPDKKPTAREISDVKGYMREKFKLSAKKSISDSQPNGVLYR